MRATRTLMTAVCILVSSGAGATAGVVEDASETTADLLYTTGEDGDASGTSFPEQPQLPDFAAERALRAAYRAKIEKYAVEQRVREYLFCDGSNPLGVHGMLSTESAYARGYADKDPIWLLSCQVEEEPDPVYEFCDPSKAVVEICLSGNLDKDMLLRYGDVGQDCGSWQVIYEYLSEDASIDELSEKCARHSESVIS